MRQAVFCSNLYFLLPPEYSDFDAFKRAVAAAPKPFELKAVVLRENHRIPNRGVEKGVCMAPFFLTGYHDAPSLLRIQDAENMYPAEVELLSQEEYNARLRELVTSYCPGCTRFKPLSNRVQSLNGHFEEIALDGFCAYRVETKPSPRCFRDLLFYFGYSWEAYSYAESSAEELCQNLKKKVYLRLDKPRLLEQDGQKTWTGRAKTALDAKVTEIVAHYVDDVFDPKYRIIGEFSGDDPNDLWENTEEEAFRADCKRYGLAILTLDYDPCSAEKLRVSLSDLLDHWYLFPLLLREGHEQYFVLDTAAVLKGLHYRLPLLRTLQLSAELHGQFGRKRYQFSDAMREV